MTLFAPTASDHWPPPDTDEEHYLAAGYFEDWPSSDMPQEAAETSEDAEVRSRSGRWSSAADLLRVGRVVAQGGQLAAQLLEVPLGAVADLGQAFLVGGAQLGDALVGVGAGLLAGLGQPGLRGLAVGLPAGALAVQLAGEGAQFHPGGGGLFGGLA